MDWTTVVATLAGGGIGLAGTGLQHRFSRRDAVKDRSKDEMQIVLGLFAHQSQVITRRMRGDGTENVSRVGDLEEINVHTALISDSEVRRRISELTWILNDPSGAAPHESAVSIQRNLLDYGRDLLSAKIRGDRLPAEPAWLGPYRAEYERYTDYWAEQYEAHLAAQAEKEERKRAEQEETGSDEH